MKHFNSDSTNYVLDKERAGRLAERQRKLEHAALKRGPWPIYAAVLLSLFCLVVAIVNVITGNRTVIFTVMYFLISIACGGGAYNFYSLYKKAKANASRTNAR